jgi:cAMP-dependent protein kinase regulator
MADAAQLGGKLETLKVEGPIPRRRGRRGSVSAEPVDMEALARQRTRIVPKSAEAKERIRNAVRGNFMFKTLDEEQLKVVIDAMEKKEFDKGDTLIKQGDDGNDFYLLDTGVCHCFLDFKDGSESKMVKEYKHGESFGELALMYNTPRAASILAMEDCITWAMDRLTFRKVVMGATYKKRALWEAFLSKVPALESLDNYQRSKVADCLSEQSYEEKEHIITEGETKNNSFYFLVEGVAIATKDIDGSGVAQEVMRYKEGDYFGELALLTSKPRAANVISVGETKVVSMDKDSFERLLGPCQDVLSSAVEKYSKAEAEILGK